MGHDTQINARSREEPQTVVVRFPVHHQSRQQSVSRRIRLSDLLPRCWRRQVVIQGRRFWLPG
jgi:hypothetical protein